ncbi:MAG: NAD(+) synthase [Syntrophomonadaceae bacterium]|jgi:NAD+ synthase|nr:NAD(+) synthase [Syntrophomonadaceae bacterium]
MNAEAKVNYLVDWLRQKVREAGFSGAVLGLSGGVDSAVAAVIVRKAFGDNCMALILPCESQVSDLVHGQMLAEELGIPHHIVDLDNAYQLLVTQFESYIRLEGEAGRMLRANLKPRLRMIALYYSAQARNYLVVGTSNKSELCTGYCTKHGDSAVDLQLLGDLTKTEVYQIARFLQIPQVIIDKAPSGGLWEGQTDEEEMGVTYQELDRYLEGERTGIQSLERIEAMIRASEHKRRLPVIARIPRSSTFE